jgi:hypothetical protein
MSAEVAADNDYQPVPTENEASEPLMGREEQMVKPEGRTGDGLWRTVALVCSTVMSKAGQFNDSPGRSRLLYVQDTSHKFRDSLSYLYLGPDSDNMAGYSLEQPAFRGLVCPSSSAANVRFGMLYSGYVSPRRLSYMIS